MAKLDSSERANLPDSAFAYVDSKGRRRLPINDESHVRNALSRFNQVRFESDEARERAFQRLLKAALDHGIAPVGFIAAEMREARRRVSPDLPVGPVALMLTDIEGSTRLAHHLDDAYPALLDETQGLIREEVIASGGYEVDARADEFFAVFSDADQAVRCAIGIQLRIAARTWVEPVRVRIGIHTGNPARTDTGYVGMPVHVASRVCSAGHGGQIVLSEAAASELGGSTEVSLQPLGRHQLAGLPAPLALFQVVASGLGTGFPPPRIIK